MGTVPNYTPLQSNRLEKEWGGDEGGGEERVRYSFNCSEYSVHWLQIGTCVMQVSNWYVVSGHRLQMRLFKRSHLFNSTHHGLTWSLHFVSTHIGTVSYVRETCLDNTNDQTACIIWKTLGIFRLWRLVLYATGGQLLLLFSHLTAFQLFSKLQMGKHENLC